MSNPFVSLAWFLLGALAAATALTALALCGSASLGDGRDTE